MTRAKKGSTLIKKVKSNPYLVENALSVGLHDQIGIKSDGEFTSIKSTELAIMDLASTGSTVSKTAIEETFKVSELRERKSELFDSNNKKEETKEEPKVDKKEPEVEELTIDDFIEDFKL